MARKRLLPILPFLAAVWVPAAWATTYEVGPGKPNESIGAVPWAALQPGDTVLIYWRTQPYKEKWVICRQGTAAAPITVRGVAGPSGELPVIDGNGAVTAPGLNYWSEARGSSKSAARTLLPTRCPGISLSRTSRFEAPAPHTPLPTTSE